MKRHWELLQMCRLTEQGYEDRRIKLVKRDFERKEAVRTGEWAADYLSGGPHGFEAEMVRLWWSVYYV